MPLELEEWKGTGGGTWWPVVVSQLVGDEDRPFVETTANYVLCGGLLVPGAGLPAVGVDPGVGGEGHSFASACSLLMALSAHGLGDNCSCSIIMINDKGLHVVGQTF